MAIPVPAQEVEFSDIWAEVEPVRMGEGARSLRGVPGLRTKVALRLAEDVCSPDVRKEKDCEAGEDSSGVGGVRRMPNQEVGTLTGDDQRVCLMVGVLMIVAKIEKQAKTNVMLLDEDGAAIKSAKDFKLLIESTWAMFPRGDMEKQVIEFAKSLGFEVEQQFITQGNQVPH